MKAILLIAGILTLTACQSTATLNTQINDDFRRITQGKTPNELADLLYTQATAKYHNQMIDPCTKMQITKSGNQVIFDNLLLDDQCGNKVRNSDPTQIQAHIQSGKRFRINEIKKTPTAVAIINGGVEQVYRYYLMPERKLVGEFKIGKDDIK
ncbi:MULTISPECIES: hypothetical protein [Moraxella]|jgi:lipoprotein|uniref:Lipoprotein n=1 Tax=Moraxella lacunata TaxID=477 RepID=A0A1B8Q761_MORLA|nr:MULTISPECIES: hypothetical protein [Moraxella]MBE9578984.1 hypothetical protein [Moraxella sp. K1664]MBE9588329.1 hypothetical protein [Moraxella sp. K1630]MBE9591386.1 hypothetical protein [Moraxella sp. K127]MBE9596460.1 hypothetical protein [Moraxella sp. K2450]MDH9218848.1 hypothetical protein [Moraxella lacunata]